MDTMSTMSEDEDCDDLPLITVNSSANDSSTFSMPSAAEVAEQRARELACERELALLRERAAADERAAAPAALAHSDSSGSEGELALAAAVTALRVQPRAPRPAPRAAALWAALAPRLPPAAAPLTPLLLHATPERIYQLVESISATTCGEAGAWADEEMLCACAVLCVALLAHEARCRRAAARALHALLDHRATPHQVGELCAALASAFPEARSRLLLSDAMRSGAGAGADRAAAALARCALLQLLAPSDARHAAADHDQELWPSMEQIGRAAAAAGARSPEARYTCVQLAGRVLAAGPSPAGPGHRPAAGPARALLAHLAPPPTHSDAHRPDRLKALVGASKLRLLFRTEL